MDNAGLIAAGIAGAVVYRLAGNGWIMPTRRRAMLVAFAFLLSVQAVVALLSTVYSSVHTNRDLALHLETRLKHMEQTIGNLEKHNSEMMGHLTTDMLSGKIKSMTTEIITADSTYGSEEDDQPQREETTDQEFTYTGEEAAPSEDDAATKQHKRWRIFREEAAPSQDDAITKQQHNPWRIFTVPEDHVFVVDCGGEELRLLIRSPSDELDHQATGNGQLPHTCGQPHDARTPSTYEADSYRALFWSLPSDGEERVVPMPWPQPDMWERLTAALLEETWNENPPAVEEKTPPKSLTLSADEVLFYRPSKSEGRTTRVVIAASEDVVHLRYQTGPAVTALAPHSVLPLSFTENPRAQSGAEDRLSLLGF